MNSNCLFSQNPQSLILNLKCHFIHAPFLNVRSNESVSSILRAVQVQQFIYICSFKSWINIRWNCWKNNSKSSKVNGLITCSNMSFYRLQKFFSRHAGTIKLILWENIWSLQWYEQVLTQILLLLLLLFFQFDDFTAISYFRHFVPLQVFTFIIYKINVKFYKMFVRK